MVGKTTFGIVIREGTSRYYIVERLNGKVIARYGFNWGWVYRDEAEAAVREIQREAIAALKSA